MVAMRPPDSLQWFLDHAVPSGDDDGPNSVVHCLCWACSSSMTVKLHVTQSITAFPPCQCQICGAITDHPEFNKGHQLRRRETVFKSVLRVLSTTRKGFAAFFAILILTVVTLGSTVILPLSLGLGTLHLINQILTWLLTALVFFNFFSSMCSSKSTVKSCFGDRMPTIPRDKQGAVVAGCFSGWTYCRFCQWVKPAGASHCRVCKVCVYRKDHHCAFLDACVGIGNMRSFLLLLAFAFVSITFFLAHMIFFLLLERQAFVASLLTAWRRSEGPMILLLYLQIFLALKWTHIVALGNLFVSISILYGVGTLLWSLLTSLSSLAPLEPLVSKQGNSQPSAWLNAWSHLSLIIRGEKGQRSIFMWIWPIWSPDRSQGFNLGHMSSRETLCSPEEELVAKDNKME
jgi:DHHC palmitoyltransferase